MRTRTVNIKSGFQTKRFLISLAIAIPIIYFFAFIPEVGNASMGKNAKDLHIEQEKHIERLDLSSIEFAKVLDPSQRVLSKLREMGETDTETWMRIAQAESGFQETVEPSTWVIHCMRTDGTYFTTELMPVSGIYIQSDCTYDAYRSGYDTTENIEVHRERSYGVFQILPSTAKGNGCLQNWRDSIENQTECAVKTKNRPDGLGWGNWTTF